MTVNTSTPGGVAAQDRRRARDERGMRSAGAVRADRLPHAPRERRPLLAAFAVLLIVGGAAAAGLLALRADERVPVLVASRDIAVGEEITADALATTPVASEGTLLVPASQQELVVGQFARIAVTKGQLVDTSMLTATRTLQDGKVAVGASFEEGRAPASGLVAGDVVQLVQVVDGKGTVLVADALVSSATTPAEGANGGRVTATLIVDESDGAELAAAAAEASLSAVLVSRGTPVVGQGG